MSISAARVAIRSDQKPSVLRKRNSIFYHALRPRFSTVGAVGRRAASIITTTSGAASNRGPITCSGQWLISGAVGVSTFYDLNIYQSTTPPILHGPGFDIKPSLLADYNTGIYETSIYGNIDSTIYPTLDLSNDTFNRQAGILQKYSPLPDFYSPRRATMPTRRMPSFS